MRRGRPDASCKCKAARLQDGARRGRSQFAATWNRCRRVCLQRRAQGRSAARCSCTAAAAQPPHLAAAAPLRLRPAAALPHASCVLSHAAGSLLAAQRRNEQQRSLSQRCTAKRCTARLRVALQRAPLLPTFALQACLAAAVQRCNAAMFTPPPCNLGALHHCSAVDASGIHEIPPASEIPGGNPCTN